MTSGPSGRATSAAAGAEPQPEPSLRPDSGVTAGNMPAGAIDRPVPNAGASTRPGLDRASPSPRLRRVLRTPHAIALYVSSVLGSGILVLPGLAGRIAGPASLLAWAALALASLPFALTFATLSARRPESGGVYAFARDAFGAAAATVAGWLFALWEMVGAPAVALIAASYLGFAFPLDRPETFVLGFSIIAAAFAINLRGIRLSSRVQLAVIGAIVGLLGVAIAVAGTRVRSSNFAPFLPHGAVSIGVAAALIFWSFLGYENVSNVAEEFENPARDFPRSVLASAALVGSMYFAVAFVTIGTGAETAGGGVAPFAAILRGVFGSFGSEAAALLAVFIVFGVVNAYTTGMSRVAYAAARDGGFPRALAHLNPISGNPDRALYFLFSGAAIVFVVYYFAGVSLTTALLVASGAAISLYVVGTAAGVRLLGRPAPGRGRAQALAIVSLAISLIVLPFIGVWLVISLLAVIGAILYFSITQSYRD
jgi:amino acid efflux transporter